MEFLDIFPSSHASINYPANSKAELIRDLAARLCDEVDIDPQGCIKALLEREALGSTGVGEGTAIPHARLQSIRAPAGVVVRLRRAIDFDAIDARPVSLVCLLLLPAGDGAQRWTTLARVARRFRDPNSLKWMRNAISNSAFHEAFLKEPRGEPDEPLGSRNAAHD